MKEVLRNPFFYYIAVPVAVALCPVLIWGVYLPNAEKSLKKERKQYDQARELIGQILDMDAERLDYAEQKGGSAEFDYATAVQNAAESCGISAAKYKLSSGTIVTSSGKKSQSANVSLDEVDVKTFAKFLSTIQLRWSNLQCTKVTLKKKKGAPDSWDADLRFNYYY